MIRPRFTSFLFVIALWVPVTGFTGTITTPQIITQTTTAALVLHAVDAHRYLLLAALFPVAVAASEPRSRSAITIRIWSSVPTTNWAATPGPRSGPRWVSPRRRPPTGLLGALLPVPVDSAGNRTEGTSERDHQNLVYRETDAIGHPLSSLSGLVAGVGLLCPSETTSFFPYFQSGLDALSWRQEVPEIFYPASLIPGLREMGTWPLQTWGGVYPRTGWTTQAEEPKAAAINAQRAGDIVTRTGQPHVYVPSDRVIVIGSRRSGRRAP